MFAKWEIRDADGNVYSEVKIGNQVWMVENLKTTRYNDSTAIPLVTDNTAWAALRTPGYCWYKNDTLCKVKCGALYNWYAAVGTGKLAPTGWHIPSDSEWNTLQNYLIVNGYNYDGTISDNKIAKSMSTKTNWDTSSIVGAIGNDLSKNNSSGFSALPCSYRYDNGSCDDMGRMGTWWSSDEYGVFAQGQILFYNQADLYYSACNKWRGYSVRLIKNK